jgi:purine nucleoside phosphorylase
VNLLSTGGFQRSVTTPLGIIGGSGFSRSGVFDAPEGKKVDTPHGPPSSPVEAGKRVAFLARHGTDHQIPPHRINHRANLWALKEAGASAVVGSCSVGSLQAEIAPGNLVVPDDYVSFWDVPAYYDDQVQHITPSLDPDLREQLVQAAKAQGVPVRDGGVYVQTRGPRLETKA